MQFQNAMIKTSLIGSFQVVQAKMEVQQALTYDDGVGQGLAFEGCLFLHQSLESELLRLHQSDSINYKAISIIWVAIIGLDYLLILIGSEDNNFMRKLEKWVTVTNLSIQLDEPYEAKDISRARIRVFEDADPALVHVSKQYADIKPNKLEWGESLEFLYTGQSRLAFQTDCEHQYGYNLEQLQVLYSAIYYLRNEMFFRQDTCHIYSPEGEKKGILKLEIRIQSRQVAPPDQSPPQAPRPLVRQDLVGLIKINAAVLEINNTSFNRKRYKPMQLRFVFGDEDILLDPSDKLRWACLQIKFEFIEKGPCSISVGLLNDETTILEGSVECSTIQKQRRFTTLRVAMFSRNGIKMGSIVLQYRYLAKQQLLDLVYSPENKLTSSEWSEAGVSAVSSRLVNQLKPSLSRRKGMFSQGSRSSLSPADRYKIGYLMNRNSDILIPKAARFQQLKAANSNVSYIDPEKSSDFFPKPQKGPKMSKSSKFDFTRQFKNNPGVGQYKLPSIWSKY